MVSWAIVKRGRALLTVIKWSEYYILWKWFFSIIYFISFIRNIQRKILQKRNIIVCFTMWSLWMWIVDCTLLVFFRRWGELSTRHLHAVVLSSDWIEFHSRDWCPFGSGPPMVCYRTALLLLCFSMLAFRPLGFKSTVPVDVVRAKSYASCPYHPACEELGVKINRPLLRSRAGDVRCCEHALKRRRSASWRVAYPYRVPWFSPVRVCQFRRCRPSRTHKESCRLRHPI